MKAIVVLAGISVLAFLLSVPPASAHDTWDAPGLRAEPTFAVFRTFDLMEIRIEGRMWSNRTGNLTLEGHTAWLNVTVYDLNHDVIVDQTEVLMWRGSATYGVTVGEVWTSTILNVSVYDFENGLSAFARVRTEMSMEYALALEDARRSADRAELRADFDMRFWTVTTWETAAFASLTATFAFIFLRVDYKRSVLAGVESYWERFVARVWPFATVPTDRLWLDIEDTYDPSAARFWRWSRQFGQWRRWKALRDEVDAEFNELEPPPPQAPWNPVPPKEAPT